MPKQKQMFFANQEIQIAVLDEIVSISAEIIGQVAVHRMPDDPQFWTITHVHSGHAVLQGIIDYMPAIAVAEALASLDIDQYWRNGCCATQAFYDEATRIIKDVAAKYELTYPYRAVGKVCEVIEK